MIRNAALFRKGASDGLAWKNGQRGDAARGRTEPRALLQRITCKRYLLSTNGNQLYHPDREAVARVINSGVDEPELLFNYRSKHNGLLGDESRQARTALRTSLSVTHPTTGAVGSPVSVTKASWHRGIFSMASFVSASVAPTGT